jgi:hypothetical protein
MIHHLLLVSVWLAVICARPHILHDIAYFWNYYRF